MDLREERTLVRLLTEDAEVLIAVLLRRGASCRLVARDRLEISGMDAAEVAGIAASYNARVADLQTIRSGARSGTPSLVGQAALR